MEPSTQYIQILDRSGEIFRRLGLRSVTMDDVAAKLGISKKTLYKHFKNKRDLLDKSMQRHFEMDLQEIKSIRKSAENPIEEMLLIGQHNNLQLATINPVAVYDAKKYYPKIWLHFEKYRHQFIYECMLDNMQRGKEQGLYREEIQEDLIARMYIARMDMFFDPIVFPPGQFNLPEVYKTFMECHIRGITSAKGTCDLEKRLKKTRHEQS